MLRSFSGHDAVEVSVSMHRTDAQTQWGWGQQAGLFLYCDDSNYIKIVLEGSKSGGLRVVMASEVANSPTVIAKAELHDDTFGPSVSETATIILRLEMSADRSSVSGSINRDNMFLQHVGTCPCAHLVEKDSNLSVGIGGHGGPKDVDGHYARFSKFELIGIQKQRLRF